MRYSTVPRKRKFVKGYGFLQIARKTGDKYCKKGMHTVTKAGIDAAKTAPKRVAQNIPETTGDLIKNKIADKISTASKWKSKKKEKDNEVNEI